MSAQHTIPVVGIDGKPLTPTTPAKARKLVRGEQGVGFFDKLNRYCIRLTAQTRTETPVTTLGVDPGAKYDGYAVICGHENVVAVKLDLPNKDIIVKKLDERRQLRHARRFRKTRRRPARFDNRRRAKGWIAPSQMVLVQSRLKVLRVLFATYPITMVGLEDVAFNHAKHRWGKMFSTVEIGKAKLRAWMEGQGANVFRYRGYETKELREQYGYKKSSDKGSNRFEAHCTDALALAKATGHEATHIHPGPFFVVDDNYRCIRRRLHDTRPAKNGVRSKYSSGIVRGLRKGLMLGTPSGLTGPLCGRDRNKYLFYNQDRQRRGVVQPLWVSSQLWIRCIKK